MGALTMEIEKINNTFLSEKHQKRKEKEQKQQYEQELFNEFYNYFRNKQHSYELNYKYFNNITKREKVLNSICKNNSDILYLNTIYSKKLKEVYKIFKDNYEYLQEREKEEKKEYTDQIQLLANDLQIILNQKLKQQQEEQQRKILEERKNNNSLGFKIFMGVIFTGVIIWLLIKFAVVIGIALAIIIFLVILGCAMK